MDAITLACVVEGHGETQALPVLLRRMAAEIAPDTPVAVLQPYRDNRSKLVQAGGIERIVQFQAAQVGAGGGVLVLLDADDDCPARLGPILQQRAVSARPDVSVSVVLANKEYEAWFLAAAGSLAGTRHFPPSMATPPDPEAIRGAKEWLSRQRRDIPYRETADQAALSATMDLAEARRTAPSFDKLWREVERLITGMTPDQPA